MLYFVLILVLAALGLLVTALITANSLWAWISIGLSVLAGVILVADFLRRRPKKRSAGEDETEPTEDAPETPEDSETEAVEPVEETETIEKPQQTEVLPAAGNLDDTTAEESGAVEEDPAEEETDAADLLVVSELDVQVLVVDEHPRYHLTGCRWLADRETIPIAVSEARELGFTPCARCGPDAKLAAEHRAERKSPAE